MHVHVGDTGDVGKRHVRNYVGLLPSINGPCVGIELREISRVREEDRDDGGGKRDFARARAQVQDGWERWAGERGNGTLYARW